MIDDQSNQLWNHQNSTYIHGDFSANHPVVSPYTFALGFWTWKTMEIPVRIGTSPRSHILFLCRLQLSSMVTMGQWIMTPYAVAFALTQCAVVSINLVNCACCRCVERDTQLLQYCNSFLHASLAHSILIGVSLPIQYTKNIKYKIHVLFHLAKSVATHVSSIH